MARFGVQGALILLFHMLLVSSTTRATTDISCAVAISISRSETSLQVGRSRMVCSICVTYLRSRSDSSATTASSSTLGVLFVVLSCLLMVHIVHDTPTVLHIISPESAL